jgi:hypothetical protein
MDPDHVLHLSHDFDWDDHRKFRLRFGIMTQYLKENHQLGLILDRHHRLNHHLSAAEAVRARLRNCAIHLTWRHRLTRSHRALIRNMAWRLSVSATSTHFRASMTQRAMQRYYTPCRMPC